MSVRNAAFHVASVAVISAMGGAIAGYLAAAPTMVFKLTVSIVGCVARNFSFLLELASSSSTAALIARVCLVAQCALLTWYISRYFSRTRQPVAKSTVRHIVSYPAFVEDGILSDTESTIASSDTDDDSCLAGIWYVTDEDLEFFKTRSGSDPSPVAEGWQLICEKQVEKEVRFWGTRRTMANGKTEYLHTTDLYNATSREVADFYLDDPTRPEWDQFISKYNVVENGNRDRREQVVRYLRSFPFGFISDREYIIARCEVVEGDTIYALSKAVVHKRAPEVPDLVRTEAYWSMWSCQTIACPWGTDKPACRVRLLHHESMKVPENLARFAIRQGMWGLVRKIAPTFASFVAKRRARVGPNDVDPEAYGMIDDVSNMYAVESRVSRDMSVPGGSAGGAPKRRGRKVASALLLASGLVLARAAGDAKKGDLKKSSKKRDSKYHRARAVA